MKTRLGTTLLALWLMLPVTFAGAAIFDAENKVGADSMPEAMLAIREQILTQGPQKAHFVEERKFPFRKEPICLEGESSFIPSLALILKYTAPQENTVLLYQDGLAEVAANGTLLDRPMPAQYENLFSLYNLNFKELGDGFTLYFEGDNTHWSIGLEKIETVTRAGKSVSVQTRALSIVMQGREGRLESMQISKGASIHISISMSDPTALGTDELERIKAQLSGRSE
ncbi:MAG: hypothetical protein JW942_03905 [Opitutales bacterium]|nr:hypothetical protein [Opitutales bacterium]